MRIVDENGKIGGRVNLVDLGIVLLLILAVLAVGYKVIQNRLTDRESVTIHYTVCIEGVRDQSVEAIKKKSNNVVEAENNKPLGNIVDVSVVPATKIIQMANGEYTKSTYPDKYDLHVTLETKGVVSKDGYFTESGKKILYGDTIGVNNDYSQMFGVVENIQIMK